MASVSTKTFTVELSDLTETTYHAARRLILHPEVLKAVKLCTGDVVALARGDNMDNVEVGPGYLQTCSRHLIPFR